MNPVLQGLPEALEPFTLARAVPVALGSTELRDPSVAVVYESIVPPPPEPDVVKLVDADHTLVVPEQTVCTWNS